MDVIRDVLDNQLVDREQRKLGKVDGIVMELQEGQPPKLTYIEVGLPVLARRLHPVLEGWMIAIQRQWGPKNTHSLRIPWSKVRNVGIDVEVDLDATKTSALAYEQWLCDHLMGHIPGAK